MTQIKKYRWLFVMLIGYNALFFGSSMLVYLGKNAAYILAAAGASVSLILYSFLYSDKIFNFICNSEKTSRFFSFIISLVALISCVATVCYSCESIGVSFLKKSPFVYVLSFVIFATICASFFGIKPVSRYAFVSGIAIFAGVIVLAFLFSDKYDTNNLYPLFGTASPRGVLYSVFLFSNIVYLYPVIWKEKGDRVRIGSETRKIILISGALIVLVCALYNMYTPYVAIDDIQNPILAVASSVDFDILFERCEVVVLVMWIFASFISPSALFTFFLDNFSYSVNLADKKAMIKSGALVIYAASLICDKFLFHEYLYMISLVLTFLVSVIIPVISFIMYCASEVNK